MDISMSKAVAEFRIVDHGVENSQYFQGHGIALTEYTDCATGCGSTPGEALDDALEHLACSGWSVVEVEESDEAKALMASTDEAPEGEDVWWYVSVDVR